ncbi:DUF1488 domain-containing protein (plasmid) [Cupriavidus sp. KK10]|jgi:hypothetical protein|uniref:DUF1488 domain-containing protein n=1 Tax=Cupriavidus sp. KK10 TaxID=1478019 RepID=UPI001BA98CFE|nr:DUF1488 domain-containing protein [Cupriavidus sp. KK10]QUN32459.1 DUF1488 domain-containing protein [Cupriavidus sp. KK10]
MQHIDFPRTEPRFRAADLSLECAARVDGTPACYAITAEALEDHFGARSPRPEDLVQALQGHRDDIESVARTLFDLTGSRNIVLHSGHFRFAL